MDGSHYMGYLVLQSSDSKHFDIIDGQQRLTTISVTILSGLRHLQDLAAAGFDAENNLKRKEQLQSGYIGYLDPVSLVSRSKLELNRNNNRFYQTYLVTLETLPQRGLNASEHQLRKAFNWFKERMKNRFGMSAFSGKELTVFLDELVDKLFFTVITVTDELNAFKVFETLNARGVRLSATGSELPVYWGVKAFLSFSGNFGTAETSWSGSPTSSRPFGNELLCVKLLLSCFGISINLPLFMRLCVTLKTLRGTVVKNVA